jgi:hypothetical protein
MLSGKSLVGKVGAVCGEDWVEITFGFGRCRFGGTLQPPPCLPAEASSEDL